MEFGYKSNNVKDLGISAGEVASFVLVGKIISVILGGLGFIIIARLLGPSDYGLYTLAIGLYGLFMTFATFNIGAYFNKFIPGLVAKKDYDQLSRMLGSGFVLSILLGLVFMIIGFAAINIIDNYVFHIAGTYILIQTASVGIIVAVVWTALYYALISFGEGRQAAMSNVVGSFVQAMVSIGLVVYGFGVEGAFLGIFAGLLAGTLYGLVYLFKYSDIIFDLKYLRGKAKQMLFFSLPLTLSGMLGGFINNFSVLFLGVLFTAGVVGSFGVATKIGNLMDIIIGSISVVLIPMFASAYTDISLSKHIGRLYDYSIYFGFLFATPMIVYVIAYSTPIISVLFSSAYATTVQTMTLPIIGTIVANTPFYISMIGVGILIGIISTFGMALATSKGDVGKVLEYSIILFVIQMLSIVALVPKYGVLGLIVSIFFINNIVAMLLYYNYVKAKLGLKVGYNIGKVLLANLILLLILYGVLSLHIGGVVGILVGLTVTVVAYPLILSLSGAVKHYELNLLRQIVEKLPIVNVLVLPFIGYAERFARRD